MNNPNISELKTHLSRYLKLVEGGSEITVMDRTRPVAKLVPIQASDDKPRIIPAQCSFHEAIKKLTPIDFAQEIDIQKALQEERADRVLI